MPNLSRPHSKAPTTIACWSRGSPDYLLHNRRVRAHETVASRSTAVGTERVLPVVARVRGDTTTIHVLVRVGQFSQRIEAVGELSNGRLGH